MMACVTGIMVDVCISTLISFVCRAASGDEGHPVLEDGMGRVGEQPAAISRPMLITTTTGGLRFKNIFILSYICLFE